MPMTLTQYPSTVHILIAAQCGNFCVAADDGENLFDHIKSALNEGQKVALSFAGVESLSTAFLNSAIGQLLGEISSEELNARLSIEQIHPDDMLMLRRVIANAKRYYADPDRFRTMQRELEAA